MRWRCLIVACCAWWGGCFEDYAPLPNNSGSLGGRVMLSGGVRGARVTVDQLDPHTGQVYQHVGDAVTDHQDGSFLIPATREASGLFQLVSRGGSYVELATGATIELDATDEIRTLLWFPIIDRRDDALASPIGHLVEARAWARFAALGDLAAAVEESTRLLHAHFGRANWSLLRLHDLSQPAVSPTEPVRAAFVHAALSYLVRDIAAEAGATPQTVNVFTLMKQWATDIVPSSPTDPGLFDGNDGNDRAPGSGLRLGLCEMPSAPGCVAPPAGCNTGHCRPLCDVYVGTARSLVAGAMIKVIRDGAVNRTGLTVEDLLGVARAISDDAAPELFGGACIETLDRTRPEVRWDESASPAADAVVRGAVALKAIGFDDVDVQPRVRILEHADLDGDSSNSVALATVDTMGLSDGDLTVTALATDLAGNTATIERRILIDNTAPQLTLAASGFFADGATWWTTNAAPVLSGTIADAHPAEVLATIGGLQIPGTISGNTWSVSLPAGQLDLAGTNVTIRVTDRAGNHAELTQRLRYDGAPPVLRFQPSTVSNEAAEVPTFAADESPIHVHNGTPIDLAVSGACPIVTKYSYLLGAASPSYVSEMPARNPLAYKLVSADDGVGIVPGSTQYRVRRRDAVGSTVVLDWTSGGAGTVLGAGAHIFDLAIVSDLVSGLRTAEATYDVEFRASDRLARTTTATRCFELRLRASPLHFTAGGPAEGHTFALTTLSLGPGAPHDLVGARLLNHDATGASLIDQPFTNGTTDSVHLVVTVKRPMTVGATRQFVIRNFSSTTTVNIPCGSEENPNSACEGAADFPSQGGTYGPYPTPATNLVFPAKLYELDAAGAPTAEIPCLAPCVSTDEVFKFAVPPRIPGGAPARRFVVMTMIGQVSALWPSGDGVLQAAPPFSDTSVAGVRYTGRQQFFSTGCLQKNASQTACIRRITRIQYRALTHAALDFIEETETFYATAAAAQLVPSQVAHLVRNRMNDWVASEASLP